MREEILLTIKRVPTVVSNYQEDAPAAAAGGGCGRNCLGKCCLPVSKLPLYTLGSDPRRPVISSPTGEELPPDFFLSTLLGQWEDRMIRGLFRYDVTACETKVIPGVHGFIAQLNEGRHLKKRPTEFRVDRVLQHFDPDKFNFTKVGQEEVLFRLEGGDGDSNRAQFFESAPIAGATVSPSVVAINVSPIEYGHVLLIPRVLECLPQRIDEQSLLLALRMAAEGGSPYFRLGYNSLGAFATINHLHFQAYYLSIPFPVEKAPTERIPTARRSLGCGGGGGVKVSMLRSYPVRGLVYEGGSTLEDMNHVVAKSCVCLQENNIPFNVLISDSGRRVFLFPQCYAEKQALGEVSEELLVTQVNPAVWEMSGHMVLKRKEDYEGASEDYAWRLLAEVSLSEGRFQEVKKLVLEAAGMDIEDTNDDSLEPLLLLNNHAEDCLVASSPMKMEMDVCD
ncbi:GDP-L-galactose phosphorylase 1-like [Iris pallida]|uniref:GDP-D-glucose phosphorylase 1 n=1 Tax=Iris pallida TaxID=29817 RepID=A0AAX6DZT9_IRIPA|nr:GDP-L-galactose phosphorylase 1-like [Iris pallida]